jgi:hypothetical protein
MASGSMGGSSGSGSGSSSQQTQYTPTPEEKRMQAVYAGQIEEQDPRQRELNRVGSENVLNLLQGKPLPGYLNKLPGGIDEATTADIANRSIKDIQPFMGQAGLLDSGVNAQISSRTAGDVRRASAEFNINNLMQLLNIGTGGQAQVVSNAQANQSTFSQSLAGLRSSNTQGSYNNKQSSSNWNAGVNIFGGICWIAAELFEGWDNPKTHAVRYFFLNLAPKWMLEAYRKHGQKVAEYISNKPVLKALIRPFFEVFAFLGVKGMEVCHG